MNSFALIEFYQSKKVRFYTIQSTNLEISETDRFISKYQNSKAHTETFSDIMALITTIGNRGAIDFYFNRRENDFQALPNKDRAKADYQGEQLRLYCYRLSDSVVCLFNGGVKDGRSAQESACSFQFYEAHRYTKRIQEAFNDGIIYLDGNVILDYKESREIIL
ncbi:MAG: hypothetical protein L3J29_02940 [Cyclobacteriaceae bacterium]|nr:hypothetical protein [Cyclobacteriaceae bacterium]